MQHQQTAAVRVDRFYAEAPEVLRSSWTLSGTRIFLLFDISRNVYRLATRWFWLTTHDDIHDACDAFEALEFVEGDLRILAKAIKREIQRVPRFCLSRGRRNLTGILQLSRCAERRVGGFRLIRTGSKGSVEVWIPAGQRPTR